MPSVHLGPNFIVKFSFFYNRDTHTMRTKVTPDTGHLKAVVSLELFIHSFKSGGGGCDKLPFTCSATSRSFSLEVCVCEYIN